MSTRPEIHYIVFANGEPKISYATREDAEIYISQNGKPWIEHQIKEVMFILYPTWGLDPNLPGKLTGTSS